MNARTCPSLADEENFPACAAHRAAETKLLQAGPSQLMLCSLQFLFFPSTRLFSNFFYYLSVHRFLPDPPHPPILGLKDPV